MAELFKQDKSDELPADERDLIKKEIARTTGDNEADLFIVKLRNFEYRQKWINVCLKCGVFAVLVAAIICCGYRLFELTEDLKTVALPAYLKQPDLVILISYILVIASVALVGLSLCVALIRTFARAPSVNKQEQQLKPDSH